MDPISASALTVVLSKVFEGTAGEAGKQAWSGLTSMVGRLFGRSSSQAVKQVEGNAATPETIETLAEALTAEADSDTVLTAALREWMLDTERALDQSGNVSNTISGNVHGSVVQARDIHGGINL